MARCSSNSHELRIINSIDVDQEHYNLEKEIDNFNVKIVTFALIFGKNHIISNGQIQIQKRGFSIRRISFLS